MTSFRYACDNSSVVTITSRGDRRLGDLGQGMVEYGLILGLIVVLIVAIFVAFEGVVDIGGDASGSLSDQGVGRAQATLSGGVY